MRLPSPITCILLGLLSLPHSTLAHSWIEQLNVIAPNGTMVGSPGFPRGNSPRGAGFNEGQMVHLVSNGPNVQPTDAMCSQTQNQYEANPRSPRLQASPGQAVALRYQENGHVSLPETQKGKPQNRGTVFVYGTTNPSSDDTLMAIHRQWTADGNGGDRRGRLIATANYDDGQCYQINGGPISQQRQQQFKHSSVDPQGQNLWCQTDILLPQDLQAGKALTLYWVWDWPTMPGVDPGLPQGKQEIYTTCMDVDIVPRAGNVQGVLNAQTYNWVPQDIGNAAVPAQMQVLGSANAVSNPAMLPFQGQPISGGSNSGSGKPSPPPQSSATSTPPAPGSSSAANKSGPASPPSSPQNLPNNGQPSNNGNGVSRPAGVAAPGVFAGTPEFGTGSGTVINPAGNDAPNPPAQQQPPVAAVPQPPAPTQPPSPPSPKLGSLGRPGRVVTVETWVTETVVKTVTIGIPPQGGENGNQSKSAKFSFSIATSPVAVSAATNSVSIATPTAGAAMSQGKVLADNVVYESAHVVTLSATGSDQSPASVSTSNSSASGSPAAKILSSTSTSSIADNFVGSGVKVVPISTASSPSSSTPQVKPIKRQHQAAAAATSNANFHMLGIDSKPTFTAAAKPTPASFSTAAAAATSSANFHMLGFGSKSTFIAPSQPSPNTFSTAIVKPSSSPASKKPQAKTNTTPCTVPTAIAPFPTTTPRENVARNNIERPPCYRRHGMFKLRARAPLYILSEGVEEDLSGLDDC